MKFETLRRVSGVAPDLETFLVEVKLVGSQALVTTIPESLKPTLDSKDPEAETGSLEKEKGNIGNMAHRKRDYKMSLAA